MSDFEKLRHPFDDYNPHLGLKPVPYIFLFAAPQREFPQFGPDRAFFLIEFEVSGWRITRWVSLN